MNPLKRLKWLVERCLHLGGYGCSDTEQLLFEYVQGGLAESARQKLEKHLADCSCCVKYVTTYRETIQATRQHCQPCTEMPEELQRRLQEFIQQNPKLR